MFQAPTNRIFSIKRRPRINVGLKLLFNRGPGILFELQPTSRFFHY